MSDVHRAFLVKHIGEEALERIGQGSNDWWRANFAYRVKLLTAIFNNPQMPELCAVQTYSGDETIDYALDEWDSDFRRLVDKLWDATAGWDCGSSSGHRDLLRFTYHAAMYALESEQDAKLRRLKDELTRLEEQRKAKLTELAEMGEEATP